MKMQTYYKITVALAFLLALPVAGIAKPRSSAQLAQTARQAINRQLAQGRKAPRAGVPVELFRQSGVAIYGYAEGGFAVVSTDDLLPDVLGYSNTPYTQQTRNDNFEWWLKATVQAADYYLRTGTRPLSVAPDRQRFSSRVLPLLSTAWGQEEPYNNQCPVVMNSERMPAHCLVGCVSTALSQILNYHRYPKRPRGVHAVGVPFEHPDTTYIVEYDRITYDWDYIRNTYSVGNYTEREARAVAQLCYSLGVACNMQYDWSVSGAMTEDAVTALQQHFGFSNKTVRKERADYTDDVAWMNLIFNELSNNRPLYYSGIDFPQGGHAFLFDGYDEEGRVHVNWGWYGRDDGYFSIDFLNPRSYNFSTQQDMIIGIEPPTQATAEKQTVSVTTPGTLAQTLGEMQGLTDLTVTGTINAADFAAIRSFASLQRLDLSAAVIAPDNRLPDGALYGLRKLADVKLPQSMTAWGDGALAGCPSVNTLTMPETGSLDYVVKRHVVYNKDLTEVIAVLPTAQDSVVVASTVQRIHAQAFEGCKHVRIVMLPAALQQLGSRALADVPILRQLHVRSALPPTVGVGTFEGVDPGFLMLCIPAGQREAYSHAAGWSALFKSSNVAEMGTTVRARNVMRRVGEENPAFTYEMLGDFVDGEPTLTCEATAESPAGQYPIRVSLGTLADSDVTLIDGMLTIEPAPAHQGESTFALGYCNGEVSETGLTINNIVGNVSAAIFLPSELIGPMAGAQIDAIRVGLASRVNIDQLTVWVRSSLTGENLAEGVLDRKKTRVVKGWNEIQLNQPMVIPADGEGLYVGYTYHHTSLSYAVSLVGEGQDGSAWFKGSDDAQWEDLHEQGAVSLEALVSGQSLPSYDLALKHASLAPDLSHGFSAYTLTADVANQATQPVNGFTLRVEATGVSAVDLHVVQTVPSGVQKQVSVPFTLAQALPVGSEVQVTLTAIDDGADENAANNQTSASLRVMKNVLLEEFTTEKCPNCPAAAAKLHTALHSKAEYAQRVAAVCHHAAYGTDWLTQPCDEEYLYLFNDGGQSFAPALMFNRMPYFWSEFDSSRPDVVMFPREVEEITSLFDEELNKEAVVALGVSVAANADSTMATLTVNGMRLEGFSAPNALLTIYVTEDNIPAVEQQGTNEPFVHQHVIRKNNSTWGVKVDWQDDTFTTTYDVSLKPEWKLSDLRFVALLANYDANDNLNCGVLNSAQTAFAADSSHSAINAVAANLPQTATAGRWNLSGQRVGVSHSGIQLVRMPDGTVRKVLNGKSR